MGLLPEGPDEAALAAGYVWLWGEVTDDAGRRAVSRMRTPHSSVVTARAALAVVCRVLDGSTQPGFQTPGGLYGPDFILEMDGVTRVDEDVTQDGRGAYRPPTHVTRKVTNENPSVAARCACA